MKIILYIDDKYDNLLPILESAASSLEMELIPAESVIEGLEILQDYHQAIDSIILDLVFPPGQMQGEEGLHKIKARFPEIPVVVLTANDSAADIATAVRCIKTGAYDYVGKGELNPLHLFHILDKAMLHADLLRKQTPRKNGQFEVGKQHIIESTNEGHHFMYFCLELYSMIADPAHLEEQFNDAAAWNLRLIQTLSGTYNGVLTIRIRLQKQANASKLRSLIGFALRSNSREKTNSYFHMVLNDFYKLSRNERCPYGFSLLEAVEVKALWNFDHGHQHVKFYRKPVKITSTNHIGFKKDSGNLKPETTHYLPPHERFVKLRDTENLYSAMLNSDGDVSFTATTSLGSLSMEEMGLLQAVIQGKIRLPSELASEQKNLISYYQKALTENRNSYFIQMVLSAEKGQPVNALAQSALSSYFGGSSLAGFFIAKEIESDFYYLPEAGKMARLAYHYLSHEALNVFRLPLPGLNLNLALPVIKYSFAYFPPNLNDNGVLLGNKAAFGRNKMIYADENALHRHFYILGQTGTGKSTMIKTMALDVIKKRKGCCIIDPHGDLYEDIRKIIPSDREDDIMVFDTANLEGSAKLNVLDFDYDRPEQKSTLIQELVKSFNMNYDIKQQGGFMFELFFRAAVLLALDPNSKRELGTPTLRDVKQIVQNEKLRKQLIEGAIDEDAKMALENVSKMTGDQSWDNFIPYINSKIAVFTDNAYVDALFNSKEPSLSFKNVLDQEKILLVRLDKGQIGFNNLNLIGGVFLSKLIMAIMNRSSMPREQRKPFYVFIDEFHNFLHDDVASALAEVRKYNVALVLANQSLGQLNQQMIDAVLGNVGNTAFFRPGVNDFHKVEHYLNPEFSREEVLKLPNFNCIARLLIDNVPSDPFVFQTIKDEG